MTISAGFDPGMAHAGLGVVERNGATLKLLHIESVTTDAGMLDAEREAFICDRISFVLRTFHPVIFGIENQRGIATAARMANKRSIAARLSGGAQPGRIGFDSNSEGAIEVVGMAKATARAYRVRYCMIEPRTAKVGVLGKGGGKGEKSQIKDAIRTLFPGSPLLKTFSSHGADATAVAIVAGRIAFMGVTA